MPPFHGGHTGSNPVPNTKIESYGARVIEPWEEQGKSFNEWFYDENKYTEERYAYWNNKAKVDKWVPAYLFRYENFHKGMKNDHIMKSTFGVKSRYEIIMEIDKWFKICVGANNKITFDS